MDKTLQVKPEFEQIIPPRSKGEFAQLNTYNNENEVVPIPVKF